MSTPSQPEAGRQPLEAPAARPQENAQQTDQQIAQLREALKQNQPTLVVDLITRVLSSGRDTQKYFSEFWAKLSKEEQTQTLTKIADSREQSAPQPLGRMRSLMGEVGGVTIEGMSAGAQKIMGIIDQVASKFSQMDLSKVPFLSVLGIDPKNTNSATVILAGLAAKIIGSFAGSLKALGGPFAQLHNISRELRVFQLRSGGASDADIKNYEAAYALWLKKPALAPAAPVTLEDAAAIKLAHESQTAPVQTQTAQAAPAAAPQIASRPIGETRERIALADSSFVEVENKGGKTFAIVGNTKVTLKINNEVPTNPFLERTQPDALPMIALTQGNRVIRVSPAKLRQAITANTPLKAEDGTDVALETVPTTA